jgi:hypothetical protein
MVMVEGEVSSRPYDQDPLTKNCVGTAKAVQHFPRQYMSPSRDAG